MKRLLCLIGLHHRGEYFRTKCDGKTSWRTYACTRCPRLIFKRIWFP